MTAIWLQIAAGLAGLVSIWLRDYYSAEKVQTREQEAKADAIQEGRQDIIDGDSDAVSARIDRVLTQNGSDAGSESVSNPAGRASTIQRLARLGIHVVKTPRGRRTPLN